MRKSLKRLPGWVKSIALIISTTFLSEFMLGVIPIHLLHLTSAESVFLYRAISVATSLLLALRFAPHALQRFRIRWISGRWKVMSAVLIFLIATAGLRNSLAHHSAIRIVEGVLWTLAIGIDEEIFSRGFIYGYLERYGAQRAAIFSSIHFGLLHLPNLYWGDQSWAYTSSQAVSAAAFGYLCARMMAFSGSIWVPIFFHGLTDFAMSMESSAQYTKVVTGEADWLGTLVISAIFIFIGAVILNEENIDATWMLKIREFLGEEKVIQR